MTQANQFANMNLSVDELLNYIELGTISADNITQAQLEELVLREDLYTVEEYDELQEEKEKVEEENGKLEDKIADLETEIDELRNKLEGNDE